ncbi:hypothetical protein F5144DRAFT_633433 [Chaetomium tenue]|uniref:Uncharacterized protein n=1 Tax=Chaetomium tenue TaxID=1854479 RepID=A0ACB7NWS8_9PEZI|nr:hypothetical protein F5144DRAFT_633433 [Chaetomium globosum]
MRPARGLFPLLTVAAAGVGVASGQFTTSTAPAPEDLAPRHSDAATLAAREHMETVRRIITRTVTQNSRQPAPTRDSNDRDDENDDDNDNDNKNNEDDTTNRRPTLDSTTTTTPTITTPTTATDTITNQPQPNTTTNNSLSPGTAAGITAAAVAGVAIIAAIAFLLWRRRQGGIRGAVVTGDYPRSMGGGGRSRGGMEGGGMEEGGGEKMLPPPPPPPKGGGQDDYGDGDGYGYGYGEGVGYAARGVGEQDLGEGGRSGSEAAFRVPPAGTMPGGQAFGAPGGYLSPQPQQQQQQRPQLWLGGDLGEPRPVSAFTVYPSPGPILPVSPMTPYRPESILARRRF